MTRSRHFRALLLMMVLLLTGCAAHPSDGSDPITPILTTDALLPAPADEAARITRRAATLWFRYLDEPMLACETRTIEADPTRSWEAALITALIEGPSAASGSLTGLFPRGTRVLSTHQEGRMLFVTLSREIMNDLPDEPAGWRLDRAWAAEVPLRRTLAMQSIAATVTENCHVDAVVILVEQGSTVTDSLRLRQGYYRDGSDGNALAAPLTRDESLLLSPLRTAEIILQCWQERDLARLYRYTARASRPDEAAFMEEMASLPHLTGWAVRGGNAVEGSAVFTLDAALLQDGQAVQHSGLILHLVRENGIWRIPMQELLARKEATP